MQRTTTYDLYDRLTGGKLDSVLRALRDEGNTYLAISLALRADHQIEVDPTTVRRWLIDLDGAGAEADGPSAA